MQTLHSLTLATLLLSTGGAAAFDASAVAPTARAAVIAQAEAMQTVRAGDVDMLDAVARTRPVLLPDDRRDRRRRERSGDDDHDRRGLKRIERRG